MCIQEGNVNIISITKKKKTYSEFVLLETTYIYLIKSEEWNQSQIKK